MGYLIEDLYGSDPIALIGSQEHNYRRNGMGCGCGRSPTGKCIGWHALSESEYQEKLKEYEDNKQHQENEEISSLSGQNT